MLYGFTNSTLKRWIGLIVIALVELTWLAIRVEMPSTGFLSYLKGFSSIFVISMAVLSVLVWARHRGKLLELPIFQDVSHNPSKMIIAHWIAFAFFFVFTIFITERESLTSRLAVYWLFAWIVTGLTAGVFWMLAVSPTWVWKKLVLENFSLTVVGFILLSACWILGYLSNRAWSSLLGPTFLAVKWLLLACGQEAVCQPAELLLGTAQFTVIIAPACAGYEGIGLISVFVGIYLWLFRGSLRFPQTLILLLCGILAIWLVNAVRITLLVLFGTYISPQIALAGFHSATGWLGFIAVALGITAVSQRMPFLAVRQSEGIQRVREADSTVAYLAPLMTLLALILVTRVFSSEFDWFYPFRVLGTAAAIWFFWRSRLTQVQPADLWSVGAIGIGVAVFIAWVGLERIMGAPNTASASPGSLQEIPTGLAVSWIIFRVLGSVITAPIAEELAFRGFVLPRLISPDFDKIPLRFTWVSFLISSFLFGVLHGRWLAGTVAGMFYAWATYRQGRVGDAIIAHATTNALIAADVLILGNWNLWN